MVTTFSLWARNNDDQTALAPSSQVRCRRRSPECMHAMSGHPGVRERAPRHPVAVTIIGFCMCFYYVLLGCESSTSLPHARTPACGSIISFAFYNSHLSHTFIRPENWERSIVEMTEWHKELRASTRSAGFLYIGGGLDPSRPHCMSKAPSSSQIQIKTSSELVPKSTYLFSNSAVLCKKQGRKVNHIPLPGVWGQQGQATPSCRELMNVPWPGVWGAAGPRLHPSAYCFRKLNHNQFIFKMALTILATYQGYLGILREVHGLSGTFGLGLLLWATTREVFHFCW